MLVLRHRGYQNAPPPSVRSVTIYNMAGKRVSRLRTTDDTTTSRSTRTAIDLDRDMTDLYQSPHCANSPEPRKVIRFGLVLARKIFSRSHDERPNSPDRTDRIFYVHATNEQQDMQRRTAEGDPRRPVKLDISAPLTSPPAPDSKLMDRNRERQAAYNRSLIAKPRPLDASGIKRWSLRSWRTQSARAPSPEQGSMRSMDIGEAIGSFPTATEKRLGGHRDHKRSESEPTPETSSLRTSSTDRFSKRLPIPFERSVMSLRIHKKPSYESMSAASAQRICIIEDPLEPVPRSCRNRGMSFSDQRWTPVVSPTALGTIEEDQRSLSPVHPGHRHATSSFSIPRHHGPPFQGPKKSASTGMLRPQVAINNHLTVPTRPGVPEAPATTNQRHIHPALRSPPAPSPTTSIFSATTSSLDM